LPLGYLYREAVLGFSPGCRLGETLGLAKI
jgi:hypothetical protein